MEKKKNVVTIEGRNEFMELCVEVLPHINAIRDALEKSGIGGDKSASISVSPDGYVSFRTYGSKWEMNRFSMDGKAKIKYEHTEEVELPE